MQDAKLIMSDDQVLTSVGNAASTNKLNIGAGKDAFDNPIIGDAGESGRLWLNVRVTEAFASSDADASVKFALQHCDTEGGTYENVFEVPEVKYGKLAAGKAWRFALPADMKQYLQMYYTVGTAAMTAGKISAWISMDSETPK